MSLPLLKRRPDRGLGNIGSSPADPSRNIDWVLLGTQAVLATIGLFIVYSTSRMRVPGDPFYYTTRQLIFTIVATFVMFVVMSIDYVQWKDRIRLLYALTIVSLVLLKLLSLSTGRDLITFELGPINIQPQELAKVTVLLALAVYLSEERSDQVSYPRFLGGLLVVGAPALLTLIQPDMGSAIMLIVMVMGVMIVAGAKFRYLVMITALSAVSIAAAFVTRIVNEYQIERLRVFLDPDTTNPDLVDASYQVRNSIRAVGTGGLFGKGWLQGPLTEGGDIPVMWADFPFAAVAEEFGFAGSALLIGVFVLALARIWRIAHLSRDLMGTYICAGVFTMLLFQVFQNIGMTVGIMPVTGLPLPFISYGGTGQLTWFIMFGLVQSVYMRRMR